MLSLYQQKVLMACKCDLLVRHSTLKNIVMSSTLSCMHMIFFKAVWYSAMKPHPCVEEALELKLALPLNLTIAK